MNKIFLVLCIAVYSTCASSQTPDSKQLHETARTFIKQGDYPNAILVLNRLIQSEPNDMSVVKDLALSYYFQKDNNKAIEIIKPLLDKDEANEESFLIAGNIYDQLNQEKESEKIIKRGIKKFPESGSLYNALGELMYSQRNYDAIAEWEKGIESDPSYSQNYYNAAKYYFLTPDKVWSIIYGEIYLNIEPLGNKTPEIKAMLLDSYKKLFANIDLEANNKDKNAFVKAYLLTMNKQTSVAAQGINPETLTMIRTRFLLEWNYTYGVKFPYFLFDYHKKLLEDGLFDAYNQWIFGSSQNLAAFQNWINTHSTEYTAFNNFQKARDFKMRPGQYYH
ncbi:MAG: tetratricopeptide repeat protein [Ferruginibacter sp.]